MTFLSLVRETNTEYGWLIVILTIGLIYLFNRISKRPVTIFLGKDQKAEHDGKKYNWFIGDYISYPEYIPHTFWAWGIPEELNSYSTRRATVCGRFNDITRQVYDITYLT